MRKEANVTSPLSGRPLELDVWLPSINLSFEFQVLLFVITNHNSIDKIIKVTIMI